MRSPSATPCAGSFLPSSSRFRLLFALAQIFHLSEKSSSQRGVLLDFLSIHPSIHPSILSTASSSLNQSCFTRIPGLCQVFGLVFGLVLVVFFSDSRFLVFI